MRHRPIAAIDADLEAASAEVARAREDFMDLPSNLARVVAPLFDRVAAGIAAERAAWTEAEARLQALLEEREAAMEALAVRALEREAAALPSPPPPPVEPIEPLREAIVGAARIVDALEAASRELVRLAPLGDSHVSVTLTPESDGDLGFDRIGRVHRALAAAARDRAAVLAFDATIPAPPLPAFDVPQLTFVPDIPGFHRSGVEMREARDAWLGVLDALVARRAAVEHARRMQAAWERTHGG